MRRSNWLAIGVVVLAAIAAGALLSAVVLIRSGVEEASVTATTAHPGDEVTALMAYVRSDAHTFRDRNRAVWALGRIADPRALPLLEHYYDGGPCDHARRLCQHELRKAIARCRGQQPP
jgi:HEAT repeat protein